MHHIDRTTLPQLHFLSEKLNITWDHYTWVFNGLRYNLQSIWYRKCVHYEIQWCSNHHWSQSLTKSASQNSIVFELRYRIEIIITSSATSVIRAGSNFFIIPLAVKTFVMNNHSLWKLPLGKTLLRLKIVILTNQDVKMFRWGKWHGYFVSCWWRFIVQSLSDFNEKRFSPIRHA